MLSEEPAMGDADEALLSLLRTKGLSIKELDSGTREELREFLDYLHNAKGMSLNDIAKLIGNKTSGYTSWLCRQLGVRARPFEEARLKGIREKRRKYARTPFDGTDEEKAYLLGLRHGDLSVSKPWKCVVKDSTSTTHPAMAQLFHSLFGRYGHVYQDPRFKEDTKTYGWNLYAYLDNSFAFLFSPLSESAHWILSRSSIALAYLAGLFDAEGSVGIYPAKRFTSLNVVYYNTDHDLMWFVFGAIQKLGYGPLEPYLDKKKGFRSPGYHIEMKKDYWRVLLARFEECRAFLEVLPIRHPEKVAKKTLVRGIVIAQPWKEVEPRVAEIRRAIKSSRDSFVAEAERHFLARPHRRLHTRQLG